ncbi:class I SAM-dependent methyltransferase [Cyanobium sp. FGCU-6]|nr:class I SAM-dependent methyltransferase [Cyanobium sp. FGCU6]
MIIEKVRKHGLWDSARMAGSIAKRRLRPQIDAWRFRDAPKYASPTDAELSQIESDLARLSIAVTDYTPPQDRFQRFQQEAWFPAHYHGGQASGVWDEKLLEHWIAGELLDLEHWSPDDVYVDIASCNSPWAKVLRQRRGLSAYAIDLAPVGAAYADLPYYRSEDATQTSFADDSVRGASLQCAYEMFQGDHDQLLIKELARILRPGGKVIILPLYMHTHYCAYATPEYFGKGYANAEAKEYIRMDCYGVPSSRKYDAQRLKQRVLDPIQQAGLRYRLLALRNKAVLGTGIYCHFILVIEK